MASSLYNEKYADELIKNAAYIGTPGRSILAADKATKSRTGKLLVGTHFENVEPSMCALCQLLSCTPSALQYLSGVIVAEDTLYQKTADGKRFINVLKENGVLAGIQVDKGTIELVDTEGEITTSTQGLDGLGPRCRKYYGAGARFAKWCTVFKIGPTVPSKLAIEDNVTGLALFAITCQQKGLVPIIDIQILADGSDYSNKCAEVTKLVLTACYKDLTDHHVLLEGTVLNTNFVTPESNAPCVGTEEIAKYTFEVLHDSVPRTVPTVLFTCGKNDWEVFKKMEKFQTKMSFKVGCSFRVELKEPSLKVLAEKEKILKALAEKEEILKALAENNEAMKKIQDAFIAKCKATSEAIIGIYKEEDAQLSEGNSDVAKLEKKEIGKATSSASLKRKSS